VSDADRGGAGIAVVPIAAKDNGRPDISAPIATRVGMRVRPGLAHALAVRGGGFSRASGGGKGAEAAKYLDVVAQRRQRRNDMGLVVAPLEIDEEHVAPESLASRP
jgi:hypothetical protein